MKKSTIIKVFNQPIKIADGWVSEKELPKDLHYYAHKIDSTIMYQCTFKNGEKREARRLQGYSNCECFQLTVTQQTN